MENKEKSRDFNFGKYPLQDPKIFSEGI